MSSGSHVGCHVTSKGMARMGVSSSSGQTRVMCFGVRPLWMYWHRCFVVRWYVLSRFTWYIVLCRSVLWSFISIMCSGVGLVASGVGRVSGMCVDGRLLVVALGMVNFIRLA